MRHLWRSCVKEEMNDWLGWEWPSALDSIDTSKTSIKACSWEMLKQRERRPLAAFPTPRLSSALPRTTWTCGFGLLCSIPDFCVLSFNIAASPLSTNSMIQFCSVHCLSSAMEKGQGFPMSCEVSYLGNTAWPIFVPWMFNLGFHFCTCVKDRWCP